MEQGGSSLSLAWLSGIGLFCRHNSQYFARLSSLTEAAVCQLARRKNRNYLHTCLGLTNEGQESQTKCVGVTLGQNECDDTTGLKYLLSSPTLPVCQILILSQALQSDDTESACCLRLKPLTDNYRL